MVTLDLLATGLSPGGHCCSYQHPYRYRRVTHVDPAGHSPFHPPPPTPTARRRSYESQLLLSAALQGVMRVAMDLAGVSSALFTWVYGGPLALVSNP